VDDTARVSNVLLTMLQRVGVKADKFQDSTGALSQIVA
jgi:FixJ family two-component response regulator